MTMTATESVRTSASRPPRRPFVIGGIAILLVIAAVVGVTIYRHQQRDEEWKHGGDALKISATVTTASGDRAFLAALTKAGIADQMVYEMKQGLVVTVDWSGPAQADGSYYNFVLLDRRVTPPRPVQSWGERGWAGAYEVLSERYPWLAGTASRPAGDGGVTNDTEAVYAPATTMGHEALSFAVYGDDLPIADPQKDLVLAVFLTRDDDDEDEQVRWAKQVSITNAR